MPEPMSDERLTYLRTYVERASGMADFRLKSAVDEIDRLRAENERYQEALIRVENECGGAGECVCRIAHRALNPEPSAREKGFA